MKGLAVGFVGVMLLASCGSGESPGSPLEAVGACEGLPSVRDIEAAAGVDGLGDPTGESAEPSDQVPFRFSGCTYTAGGEFDQQEVAFMVAETSVDDLLEQYQSGAPDDGWRRSSLVEGGIEGNTALWVEGSDGFSYGVRILASPNVAPYEEDRALLELWGKI
jgi:hypothetical protein